MFEMDDIKNKIIDLFNDIEKKNISYDDLKYVLESILEGNVDKNGVFSFLDLLHLSTVSKIISKRGDIDFWAMKVAHIIEKYNFHSGQLFLQRVKRYKEKTLFITIKGDNKKTISYNKFWNDLTLISRSIQSLSKISDTTLGILSFNQYESAAVDLCCLAFGFRVVPIPLNSTGDHLSYIIDQVDMTHLFLGGDKAIRLFNSVSNKHKIKIIDINNIGSIKGDIV